MHKMPIIIDSYFDFAFSTWALIPESPPRIWCVPQTGHACMHCIGSKALFAEYASNWKLHPCPIAPGIPGIVCLQGPSTLYCPLLLPVYVSLKLMRH